MEFNGYKGIRYLPMSRILEAHEGGYFANKRYISLNSVQRLLRFY